MCGRFGLLASALVLALFGSCADSCACGKRTGAGSATLAKPAQPKLAAPPAPPPSPAPALGAAGMEPPPRPETPNPNWTPAPPSELQRKLTAQKLAIESDRAFDALASQTSLAAALPDQLGKFKAESKSSGTTREDDVSKLAIVVRDYKAEGETLRVKITDTALMPAARRAVSERLTTIGNAATGNEHGVLAHGTPALVSYLTAERTSRATALVGQRFLVQIIVRGANGEDDALQLLEQLKLSAAAPARASSKKTKKL